MNQEFASWHGLRSIGNSQVAKLSYLIPLVGYFILFNGEVVKSLQLHTNFCTDGCNVTWRLQFFYFGGCAFALATGIYALRCPTIIKRYESDSELFNNNQTFLSDERNLIALAWQTQREGGSISHQSIRDQMMTAESPRQPLLLPAVAAEIYLAANKARPLARYLCLILFAIGGLLLGAPAIKTFCDVALLSATQWRL